MELVCVALRKACVTPGVVLTIEDCYVRILWPRRSEDKNSGSRPVRLVGTGGEGCQAQVTTCISERLATCWTGVASRCEGHRQVFFPVNHRAMNEASACLAVNALIHTAAGQNCLTTVGGSIPGGLRMLAEPQSSDK